MTNPFGKCHYLQMQWVGSFTFVRQELTASSLNSTFGISLFILSITMVPLLSFSLTTIFLLFSEIFPLLFFLSFNYLFFLSFLCQPLPPNTYQGLSLSPSLLSFYLSTDSSSPPSFQATLCKLWYVDMSHRPGYSYLLLKH